MTSPFAKAAGAPKVDLDSAEAHDPDLDDTGEGTVEIQSCDFYDGGFGPSFSALVKVVDYSNDRLKAGDVRKIRISNLAASDKQGGKAKRMTLREFLAAALGVSPTLESPDGGEHTWSDLLPEVTEGEGTALAGRQIGVKTTLANTQYGPKPRYKFVAV